MKSIVDIDGIGPVTLRRSRRARRICIRVEAFAGVVVAVPLGVSIESALNVVERHRSWVMQHLKVIREQECFYVRSANTGRLVTRTHILEAHPTPAMKLDVRIHDGVISVRFPKTMNLESPQVQHTVRDSVLKVLRSEAKEDLPDRVRGLASRHGFSYGRLALKNLRSRWGSCSPLNNLNLNIQLMRLPDELVDYVVLHELVHTKVKNHSPAFWRLLDKVAGGARALDAKLRKQRVWGG